MSSTGLVDSFLSSLQASLSVLLTLSYGVIAAQFRLLTQSSTKDVSKLCVRMFLPALLITNVGSQLHANTATKYIPILIWSLFYTLSSMAIGRAATKIFKLPSWVTPAICFNNTTSLPLLLIQSLETTGILSKLIIDESDTTSEALQRAKSYLLVNAIVGNCLTFAIGPRLLDTEHAPDKEEPGKEEEQDGDVGGNGDVEQANGHQDDEEDDEEAEYNETTSLLPNFMIRGHERIINVGQNRGKQAWSKMPEPVQNFLSFAYSFFNAPLIGAIIGAIIGLVPALHKAFFSDPDEGGIFKGWLTTSMKNVGDLFASLQIVVVGVNFSSSLRKAKRGEDSGSVPWMPSLFIIFIRFVFWPAISISVIWAVAAKTSWLSEDPILWFTLMMMPTGPPAMKIMAMSDLTGADESEKMSIAKFLTISYAISPLICFTVVGSLKASEAVIASM